MPRRESSKTQFIAVRMSASDAEALRAQAEQCGLSISELIRRRVTGQRRPIGADAQASVPQGQRLGESRGPQTLVVSGERT
jgi:hypothetical protein